MMRLLKAGLYGTVIFVVTACTSQKSEPSSVEQLLAERGFEVGEPVERIQRFRVNGWNYLDRQNVIVTVDASRRFLISLRVTCNSLLGAEVIAFTNTVSYLTTFDNMLVRDRVSIVERCPIQSMHELKRIDRTES